jgi:hypothetical protein
MKRRRYLRAVGAGTAVVVAGCSGGGGDGDDEDDGTAGTPERGATYHIDVAVGRLNTAAIALAEYQQAFSEGDTDVEFAAERQRERLAAAREALDAAADSDPDAEQTARIEGLRVAADALETASASVGELRTATDELDDLEPAVQDREFSVARDRLAAPADRVSSVSESVSTARSALDGLDAERMDATNLRFSELREGIRELDDLVSSFDALLAGYDAMIAAGETLQRGRQQFRAEQYRDARTSLEEAGRLAQTASERFAAARTDAPERLRDRFATALCQSRRLSEAISLFDDAAKTAIAGGDPSEERAEAEVTLRSIEDCGP